MSVPAAGLAPVNVAANAVPTSSSPSAELSTRRLNIMRIGYLFMGIGLVLVKWPLFLRDGGLAALPAYEGVVAALLTAMSLLAFLGLRYPIKLIPVLLFESLWKLIWLAAVGVPQLVAGDLDAQTSSILANVSLVVVILVVIPWDYVWKQYVRAPGAPWR
jgi:hypothetical protein